MKDTRHLTCNGITMMNIFLSLSDNMCLTNAHPAPIRTIVMKSRAPFILLNSHAKLLCFNRYVVQLHLRILNWRKSCLFFSWCQQDGVHLKYLQHSDVVQNGPGFLMMSLLLDEVKVYLQNKELSTE